MRLLSFLVGLICAAAACADQPKIVVTHTVLADLVRNVAGPEFEVKSLLPVEIDPHSYEPKPADLRLLAHADLVIENGLGFEPWAQRLVTQSGFRGRIVRVGDGLPHPLPALSDDHAEAHGHAHDDDDGHEEIDPHAWHDVRNAQHYVRVIARALTQTYPRAAETFAANADAYQRELDALHAFAQQQLSTLPEAKRKLVTAHDSLRYLGSAYGLTLLPIAGSRPDEEPSARELASLVRLLRRENIRAVFFEHTSSPKLAELVAREAGVKVVDRLYTDSLGAPGTDGATYVGMIRANVATLVDALR